MPPVKQLSNIQTVFDSVYEELTQIRIDNPERAFSVATGRKRRSRFTLDGKLNIIAADHPARRVVKAGREPLAMADRREFLSRIVAILAADAADGVMATMDVLEELLLLHDLLGKKNEAAFLDNKLMIASLNRGGIDGAVWEMDDPMTGPSVDCCRKWKLDGAKVLLRICDTDANSAKTVVYCSQVITECNRVRLPLFVEPLPVVHTDSGFKVVKEADSLAKIVGVATALGEGSQYMWLKLPYCPDFASVARSTTVPIVLLGGDLDDKTQFLNQISEGLAAGQNVRGTMVGRNVLYPGSDADPVQVSQAVHTLVHKT
jgi:DhnA family fructose-bisphosphate aldolase class Ia